jgi:hypothetical protein
MPDLPFVLASTGMDGGTNYTKVELGQKALADKKAHPEFVGNVAVIDTRKSYEGLTFWEDPEYSPTTQGFHWNGNAKTYVNIGLAMADAMSMMTPGPNPFRLRATGEAGGVLLRWQNGTMVPTSVRILRNGDEIAAVTPGKTASYLDETAKPGTHKYELMFTMPDASREPLTMTFRGGITDLKLALRPGQNVLTWTNNMAYDSIRVSRNGIAIGAALPGTATTFTDITPPTSGLLSYSVVPANCEAAQAAVQRDLNLRCELGILDLTANDGINPATRKPWKVGDQYRLAFVSSVGTRTESSALSIYDAFLKKLAAGVNIGGTWKVIGSSDAVDARDHTGTNPEKNGFGAAIFLLDGKTVLANSNPDLWSGSIRARFDRTEGGSTYTGPVYTGSNANGTKRGDHFGNSRVEFGTSDQSNDHWALIFGDAATKEHPLYALSDPLTIFSGAQTPRADKLNVPTNMQLKTP